MDLDLISQQQQSNWDLWEQSEFKQHNSYEAQDKFGPPMPQPNTKDEQGNEIIITVLPFVWTYLYKMVRLLKLEVHATEINNMGKQ